MNTQHLEEMGCKFAEALVRLKARHMMRSLPLQGGMSMAAVSATTDVSLTRHTSTFVDEDFSTYDAVSYTHLTLPTKRIV